MSKCFVCNSKKGKRPCLLSEIPICTLCCGQTRKKEVCEGCSFYSDPVEEKRKYNSAPTFSTQQMADNFRLQDQANVIEAALCKFDYANSFNLQDEVAIQILELLLDKYFFQDEAPRCSDRLILEGVNSVVIDIKNNLASISGETLVKILSVIYTVAKRRGKLGGRPYFDFIKEYVGFYIAPGARQIFPKMNS
jgi:hypothetical protein